MISQMLLDARRYEADAGNRIAEDMRPGFHLTPRTGWMNDPNGFCFYKGQYHLFYQYYPYKSRWDSMHWGHAVSSDLLHWEYLPAVLAPDRYYDQDGVFSGSAIELPDGQLLLMYTGVRATDRTERPYKEVQTQCIAVGDGIDFEKYGKNPVLDENDLPAGASRQDFRDPKMLRLKDGRLAAIVANRPADGSGQILLYTSEDGYSWKYETILAENRNRFGKMWECPDFFELDGKQVLLVSPQDMLPQGYEYHSGNGTLCLIGRYDETCFRFEEESNQAIDYGIDFYAPQTVLTPDGRRVMIGWMQNWDACAIRSEEAPWAGQMSLPREIHIRDGRLYQWPIREFDALRHDRVEYKGVEVSEEKVCLDGISGRMVDMEIRVRPKDPASSYNKFVIRFAEEGETCTSIRYRPHESTLKIDRKFSGSRRAILHQRRCFVEDAEKELKLRIILDRYSCEIFIDGGRKVMTAGLYTEQSAKKISFRADGNVVMDITKYSIM